MNTETQPFVITENTKHSLSIRISGNNHFYTRELVTTSFKTILTSWLTDYGFDFKKHDEVITILSEMFKNKYDHDERKGYAIFIRKEDILEYHICSYSKKLSISQQDLDALCKDTSHGLGKINKFQQDNPDIFLNYMVWTDFEYCGAIKLE